MAVTPASNFGRTSLYQDNPNALTAPSATDDVTAGFLPGSRWYDTTHAVLYMCIDNTASAAIWQRVLGGGVDNVGTVAGGNTTIRGGSAVTATGGDLILEGGAGSIGGSVSIGGATGAGGTGTLALINITTVAGGASRTVYLPSGAGAVSVN